MSVCSLGYTTENTPSKKTSLRWGDDCPEVGLQAGSSRM